MRYWLKANVYLLFFNLFYLPPLIYNKVELYVAIISLAYLFQKCHKSFRSYQSQKRQLWLCMLCRKCHPLLHSHEAELTLESKVNYVQISCVAMICFFLFKKSFFMASWLHGYEVAKGKPVISIDVVTNTGFWFTFCAAANFSNNWQNSPTKKYYR